MMKEFSKDTFQWKKGFTDFREAELLWNMCMMHRPKWILEIGRNTGVSTLLFAMALRKTGGEKLISIDGHVNPLAEHKLEKHGLKDYVQLINQWSPWILFEESWEVDLLYIDGDHTYISALVDYHYFNYFVKRNGLIAFHDANRKTVARAIKEAVRRDKLKKVGKVCELAVFQKAANAREANYRSLHRRFEG